VIELRRKIPKANQNAIHATAIVGRAVKLGKRNVIGPYAIIDGEVAIGDDNWIGPHVVIGLPAQHSREKFELRGEIAHGVRIGDRNVLREHVTVHQPCRSATIIENDCYIMAYSHVSHDSVIRNAVVLSNSVQTGGFSEIQRFANVGLGSVLHQFSTIGALAMVGMGTVVTKDVPPFLTIVGNPCRVIGVNTVGLVRLGFTEAEIKMIKAAYERHSLPLGIDARVDEAVQAFVKRNKETGRGCMIEVA
jgi:UDP-N-acetylglucosamine acyltransferase